MAVVPPAGVDRTRIQSQVAQQPDPVADPRGTVVQPTPEPPPQPPPPQGDPATAVPEPTNSVVVGEPGPQTGRPPVAATIPANTVVADRDDSPPPRDVTRKVHPVIKVEVGQCPCVDLRFTFAVTAHFSGVKLIISGGRIRGGSLGDTAVSAELSYEGVPLHSPAESKTLSLGGDFTLPGEGVRIPRFTT